MYYSPSRDEIIWETPKGNIRHFSRVVRERGITDNIARLNGQLYFQWFGYIMYEGKRRLVFGYSQMFSIPPEVWSNRGTVEGVE